MSKVADLTPLPPLCRRRGGNRTDGVVAQLLAEARLARREIREGRLQRTMAVLAAFSAVVSGFEAYSQHLRGAFRHWLMWTPVVLTLPMVAVAGIALFSERVARRLLPIVSLVSLADGVIGFVFHVRGIQKLPGGLKLGQYNVVIGPPIFAPLLVCIVGVLGLFASTLRREIPLGSAGGAGGPDSLPPLVHRGRPRPAREGGIRRPTPHSPMEKGDGGLGLLPRLATAVAHGRFQQGMALTAASLTILAGGEAYFEHLRGSFNQRLMWTPVWLTPPMVAAAIGAARSERVARDVLPVASAVTFVDGLLGFGLHLRGLKRMPGGLGNLQYGVVAGPPLFAPLLFAAVGLLGFVASLMRRGGSGR